MATTKIWVMVRLATALSVLSSATNVGSLQAVAQHEFDSPLERLRQRPATTVADWMTQIAQSRRQITQVRVEATEAGLQVVLETAVGHESQFSLERILMLNPDLIIGLDLDQNGLKINLRIALVYSIDSTHCVLGDRLNSKTIAYSSSNCITRMFSYLWWAKTQHNLILWNSSPLQISRNSLLRSISLNPNFAINNVNMHQTAMYPAIVIPTHIHPYIEIASAIKNHLRLNRRIGMNLSH